MSNLIFLIIGIVLGFWVGNNLDSLRNKIAELEDEMQEEPEVKTGPTLGSYKKVDEVNPRIDPNPKKPRARVVLPKTPQKVDWDAAQELNEQNKFKVGPGGPK